MILDSLELTEGEFASRTGWRLTAEGACKDDRCVPLPPRPDGAVVDVRVVAERLGMPLVENERHGVWSLGPESGGHALATAAMPDLVLPGCDGTPFDVASLRGKKVLLLAWASW